MIFLQQQAHFEESQTIVVISELFITNRIYISALFLQNDSVKYNISIN